MGHGRKDGSPMFKPPSLSRADAHILYEAGDVAEAQMRLVEQVKNGTGAFAPSLRRLGNPAFLTNAALMVAVSALLLGAWS